MIETMSKKVSPSQEQITIDIYTSFGWIVKSSQEINSKESHLENREGELYSVTTKENYVKLLFQRDTEMKNYAELRRLESEYNTLVANNRLRFEPKDIILAIVLTVVVCPVGIGFIIYKFVKALQQIQKKGAEECGPILAQARRLL